MNCLDFSSIEQEVEKLTGRAPDQPIRLETPNSFSASIGGERQWFTTYPDGALKRDTVFEEMLSEHKETVK